MSVLGIDPGNTGALTLISLDGRILQQWDMPVWHVMVGKTKRGRIDMPELRDIIEYCRDMEDCKLAVIEAVGGRPRQSASGAFVFGYGVGAIMMACVCSKLPIDTVAPQTWKRIMKCPKDDEGICARAQTLFIGEDARWRGKGGGVKHDRAESAMIGLFGVTNMLRNIRPDADWRLTGAGA